MDVNPVRNSPPQRPFQGAQKSAGVVSNGVNFPKIEEQILKRWKAEKTFEKSVERRKDSRRFVFYEGPPTANGRPGIHHVLSRAFKDIVCRYKTMRGFLVERKAGWDTHGLAVEIETEKKLGLKSKKDIEQYGIEKFNAESKKSVWEYKQDWENLTERIGFWIDTAHPYITYETSYIETLWQVIKRFWDKGLLYKDYRIVPYCSRCGTPLSSHEVAQGYKTIKEPSVYVKFMVPEKSFRKILDTKYLPRAQAGQILDTYFLAWTTTPWTLPANIALAVNPDISYVVAQVESEYFILAQNLAKTVLGEHKVVRVLKGKDLVGLEYLPLFRFGKAERGKKIYEVVPANFVAASEGTGVVHTAVAYGEDDFQLGKKENLAMFHLVDEEGKFTKEVTPWRYRFVKDADPLIGEDLKSRGLLFKTELYEHEYPFCWRCSTPLLYYAKDSWFVNMQKVKQNLIKNNKEISWFPAHIKEGRFGEWLKEVRDWAFSRERYWGTPLPVWECKECKHVEVIGSLCELQKKGTSSNAFYVLKHGESLRQKTQKMSSWPEKTKVPLTPKGRKDIEKLAKMLKKKHIDYIFSSDLLRTKQTAEILGKELKIKPVFDARLREVDVGFFNGKHIREIGKVWGKKGETSLEHYLRRFEEPLPKGESWVQVRRRMVDFVRDIERKYKGKTILLISHELPISLLETALRGLSREETIFFRQQNKIEPGEVRILPSLSLPLNNSGEVDLHRPYVDEVKFSCTKCNKGTMERVREVVDVWFDSGAMPFAQGHWPFAQNPKSEIRNPKPPKEFPADYIVEAIDQTRGWFYTLLAVSTLLGFKAPYKNVICLSHVLDEKGEKMSKSKGNTVNPWDMINKYGIDAVRWYFYTVNNPGDPKLFSEKDIQQATRSFLLTFWNCFVFYETYKLKAKTQNKKIQTKSKNILDSWILSRLQGTIQDVTEKLDAYDVTGAGRAVQDFVVNDLSLWYIRRSRKRAQKAASVLGFVLSEVCKLSAPFIPFLAEHIFQALGNKESVHWQNFPQLEKKLQDTKLEQDMAWVRGIVAKTLALRAKAGIKVRQPLSKLKVKNQKLKVAKDLLVLLKDEVNVKEVLLDDNLKQEVELDTRITPKLKEQGMLREITRAIQEMRKAAGYKPSHRILLWYSGDGELCTLVSKNTALLKKSVGAKTLGPRTPSTQFTPRVLEGPRVDKEKEIEIESKPLWLGMKISIN